MITHVITASERLLNNDQADFRDICHTQSLNLQHILEAGQMRTHEALNHLITSPPQLENFMKVSARTKDLAQNSVYPGWAVAAQREAVKHISEGFALYYAI